MNDDGVVDGDRGVTRDPCGRSSPGIDYADYYAYFVSSGGGVDNYSNADWDSCGINFTPRKINFRSPYVDHSNDGACIVHPGGYVNGGEHVDWDSCGRKDLSGHQ